MKDRICKCCSHFRQHYLLESDRCSPVYCGHCVYPGIKHRRPDHAACAHFEERKSENLPNRTEVVDFLTTKVLQWILEMPLPPGIAEDEGFD